MRNKQKCSSPKPFKAASPNEVIEAVPVISHTSDSVRLLTVPEAADRLRMKPSTIRSWRLRREKLEFVKIGRRVHVTERSVIALINANILKPEK